MRCTHILHLCAGLVYCVIDLRIHFFMFSCARFTHRYCFMFVHFTGDYSCLFMLTSSSCSAWFLFQLHNVLRVSYERYITFTLILNSARCESLNPLQLRQRYNHKIWDSFSSPSSFLSSLPLHSFTSPFLSF